MIIGNLWRKTLYFKKFLNGRWKLIEDKLIFKKYSKSLRGIQEGWPLESLMLIKASKGLSGTQGGWPWWYSYLERFIKIRGDISMESDFITSGKLSSSLEELSHWVREVCDLPRIEWGMKVLNWRKISLKNKWSVALKGL